MKNSRKITMRDIAERVGVSVNSVSKALSNQNDISTGTRNKILKVAQELGYQNKHLTQNLTLNNAGVIGLITTDNANPFCGQIVKSVQTTLHKAGYTMMLFNTDEDYIQERAAVELLIAQNAKGIILTPSQAKNEDISYLKSKNIPFVLLGRHFSQYEVPCVISDDAQGAKDAVSHLLRLGHKRILFLNAPSYISSAKERLAGYESAFKDIDIEVDPTLIRSCRPDKDGAYNELNSILLEGLDFTAIFTFNDLMMLGVISVLQQRSIPYPESYSLIGFDDIEFVSLLTPPLTTVAQDCSALGVQSAEFLLRLIRHESVELMEKVIPTRLNVRGSTCKI
jgi:LacI family transcriptional regulator